MEGELSAGAKIAITVILICVLIGIVFGIITFVTGKTDAGTEKMESTMSVMGETDWNQYDQRIKTGSQVMSTIQLYEGQDVGVVVQTKRNGSTDGKGSITMAAPGADGVQNYGAAIENLADPQGGDGTFKESAGLKADQPANKNYASARNSSNANYVRSSAKFESLLIKDPGGQIIGIYFYQK